MGRKKTPDYVKKAIDKYRQDKKQVSIIFSPDQWEKLENIGIKSGADIKAYLLKQIEQ